jgi:hypothetical protein
MERRRVAVVLAGLVLVGGAVAALRLSGGTSDDATAQPTPLPTSVRAFAAEGVLAPVAGTPPAAPGRVALTSGPRRLQLRWGSTLPGGHDPRGAVGYDVRWGTGATLDHDMLVAEPHAELDGLVPGRNTRIEVESVDAFGQRSTPSRTSGRAQPEPPAGADNALVDHFDGPRATELARWEVASFTNCLNVVRATGRMVILSQCGQSPATVRSRTQLRLRPAASAPGGELGRFTIDTDAPGENGELDVDLVPGPVFLIDGAPNDTIAAAKPGTAALDGDLPPGTIRVRIVAAIDANSNVPSDTVQVAVGADTPHVAPVTRVPQAIPPPETGMSARWDVVLRTDGVAVFRDGAYVGGANVVPSWSVATPLVEFSGQSLDQQRQDVNMIGLGGEPTSPPPDVPGPRLTLGGFPVVSPGAAKSMISSTDTGPGSALLRVTVVASPNTPTAKVTVDGRAPRFGIELGNVTYAATPAVPDTPLLPEVRYSLVVRIPASALRGRRSVPTDLVIDAPTDYPAQVQAAFDELEIVPGGHLTDNPDHGFDTPLSAQGPQLAGLDSQVLNASGQAPPGGGRPLPRGRAVLAVTMDDVGTERATGEIAGLAGFEVWLDNKELVAVPTAVSGPGLAGTWDIAFDTASLTAGPHTVDVKSFSTQHGVPFGESLTTFVLGR